MNKLDCFVCYTPLKNIAEDGGNQPMDGTDFISYGHYGSTVHDPMDGSILRLNICDMCLRIRWSLTQYVPKYK